MLTFILAFSTYIAIVVAILATSRKPADTESLIVLAGKVLLVHAILATSGFEIALLITYPIAGGVIAGIGAYAWIRTRNYRRQLRALKWFQGRLVKLR